MRNVLSLSLYTLVQNEKENDASSSNEMLPVAADDSPTPSPTSGLLDPACVKADTPDAIRQSGAIFPFFKTNKTVIKSKI